MHDLRLNREHPRAVAHDAVRCDPYGNEPAREAACPSTKVLPGIPPS